MRKQICSLLTNCKNNGDIFMKTEEGKKRGGVRETGGRNNLLGRKGEGESKHLSIRVTPTQHRTFLENGSSEWLRGVLDAYADK